MNIVITGASRGIGFETALYLSNQEGCKLLALARSGGKLLQLEARAGDNLKVLSFDLEKDNPRQLDDLMAWLGTVDVLVNNAGWLVNKDFDQLSDSDWRKSFEINVLAPVKMIRYLLPLLTKSAKAHVVNISSMGGFQGSGKFPGLAAYSSSKAALANLTEVLAEEFKDNNIAVNCLALGAVQTEMLDEAFPGFKAPLQPVEMAEFVAWFALNGQRFFNGKILPVAITTP